CLAGRVGAVRCQRRLLGERPCRAEAAVDLISADVQKASDLDLPGGVEQHLSAKNVGADERSGIVDAAIDVRFGGEVDDAVGIFGGSPDHVAVGNAAVDEAVARVPLQVAQVGQVARVGQAIKVDHGDIRGRFQQVADEIAADETATARYQNRNHEKTSRET